MESSRGLERRVHAGGVRSAGPALLSIDSSPLDSGAIKMVTSEIGLQ